MSGHLDGRAIAAFDDLDGAARRRALAHARDCADCRARLTTPDPTRLFALLSEVPLPGTALARLEAGLAEALGPATAPPVRRRLRLAAPLAASLLLAAALGALALRGPAPAAPLARIETQPTTIAARVQPATGGPATSSRSGLQLIQGPESAQVIELSVGQTQVVMIFDKDLDL